MGIEMAKEREPTDNLLQAIVDASHHGYVVSFRRMNNGDFSVRVAQNLHGGATVTKAYSHHIRGIDMGINEGSETMIARRIEMIVKELEA